MKEFTENESEINKFLDDQKLYLSLVTWHIEDAKGFYSGSSETFPDGNSKMQEEIKSNENRNCVVKPL